MERHPRRTTQSARSRWRCQLRGAAPDSLNFTARIVLKRSSAYECAVFAVG